MTDVKVHEFKVTMTCEGCSGAVERVLGKLKGKGVEDFNVNLENQKVQVKSSLPANEILEVIKKTGKETQLISSA
ncbi:metal homeostasis factor ATX1 [Anoplophora glabripennis]|uniref:metal homeostasis factor ATX1 n=1 Tax=Anoplophora glabripennis TaxID=217634 RepID=UPI0008752592|nr:metal homeostasis factor ATX1 [Anoplophora glabripennis]